MNPGEVHAGWTLRRRLGEGGFAEVWLAERDGQEAALKILHRLDHPGLIRRFLREGRLLRRLSHPAFLHCREVVESPTPTLVLEVLYGEPLDRRLSRGPLPIRDATRIADELLSALQLLHEHGIVHRDVKPANIWLAANDRVVLMDLGLASDAADPLTSTLGEVLGTYAYMAPEQIAGGEADQRSDLYSLGVTLYEVVVGARPYQARGMAGYLAAHRSGRAIPLSKRVPGVAPRLASLVERVMARDPAARPPTAAVAAALLRGEPWPAGVLQVPALVGRDGVRGAVEALLDGGGGDAATLRLVGGPGSGLDAVLRNAITQAAEAGVEHARMRLGAKLSWADLCGALAFDLEPLAPDTPAEPAALAEALRGLAAVGPSGDDVPVGFLLVVDPVDRAPPELVAWLRSLAGTPGLALLVAGRVVPAELGGFEHRLRPLRLDETRALVASMLGTPLVPEGLDAALHAAGGGLPGWTVSVMRGLAGAGVLRCTGTDDRGVPSWSWDPERALGPIAGGAQAPFRLPLLSMRVMAAMVVAAVPLPVALVLQAVGADRSGMALGPLLRLGLLERRLHEGEEYLALRRPDAEAPLGLRLGPEARAKLARALEAAAREHPRLHPRSRERILRLTHGAGLDAGDTERLVEAVRAGERDRARALVARLAPEVEGEEGRERRALLRAACARLEGDTAACAQAAVELREQLRAGRLPDEGLVGLVAGELEDIAASRVMEGLRESATELARPERLVGPWALLPAAAVGWRHAHLEAERLRRGGRPDAAIERLRDARAQTRDPEGARWLFAVEAELQLLCGGGPALAAPPAPDPRRPVPPALAAVERVVGVDVALAQAGVAGALERAGSPGGDDAWTLAADQVCGVLVSLPLLAPRDVPFEDRADPGRMPWFLRRRWLRGRALARLLVEDRPAGLDALLRGAEAARLAGDAPEQWFHEGLAGVLTAREETVGRCMEALAEAGLPGLRAWLLALGARFTRDPEVLVAAELAAREAGDRLLLLLVLAQLRGPGAQEEAEHICALALDGFHGPERLRFQARPEVRWACREGGI